MYHCSVCQETETLYRERSYSEREWLDVADDGVGYVHSSDMEGPHDAWVYTCSSCGASGADVEDVYEPIEEDDDE